MNENLVWEVRAFVYRHFAETTQPPTVDETAFRFSLTNEQAAEAYQELERRHALFLAPGTHDIQMAWPFSGVETPFKVHARQKIYFAKLRLGLFWNPGCPPGGCPGRSVLRPKRGTTVKPAYKPQELEYVLRQSRANGLFLVSEYRGRSMRQTLEAVRGNLPELGQVVLLEEWDSLLAGATPDRPLLIVRPDDPPQIQYTSGTTGFPKGAVLRHRGITNDARFCAERLGMGAADILINAMPLFHTAGCVLCTLGTLQRGSACVLTGFDPGLVLELIETERVTDGGGVPTMMIAVDELRSRFDRHGAPNFDRRCGWDVGRRYLVVMPEEPCANRIMSRAHLQRGMQTNAFRVRHSRHAGVSSSRTIVSFVIASAFYLHHSDSCFALMYRS